MVFSFIRTIVFIAGFLFFQKAISQPFVMVNKSENNEYPDIIAKDTSGQEIRLSQLKAKTLLLFFWSPECAYCDEDISKLSWLTEHYKPSKLKILAFNTNDSLLLWKNKIRSIKGKWVHICDGKGGNSDIIEKYNVTLTPTYFLFDKNKKMIIRSSDIQEILPVIDKLIHDRL